MPIEGIDRDYLRSYAHSTTLLGMRKSEVARETGFPNSFPRRFQHSFLQRNKDALNDRGRCEGRRAGTQHVEPGQDREGTTAGATRTEKLGSLGRAQAAA